MKKHYNLILAFLIPIIIFTLILILNGYYPFGSKNLLFADGLNQYPGFLANFIDSIKNGQSLLYSFKGLLGVNILAPNIYYVFNITNIFALLFKTENMVDFYTIMIIVKTGLASLTMCIYLNYVNKNKFSNLMFSLCYGLIGFNVLFYINYMWFDAVILLPLVILGIEKIFKENKYLFYTIFLTLTIITNFYMGYMICIFSVIYFIYKLVLTKNKKVIIKYILYSLIAGMISAIVLMPVIYELLNGKGMLFADQEYFKFDADGISAIYKLTMGSYLNEDLKYGSPTVYTSIFALVNVFFLFINKKISKKEKIISGIIILFFLLSMSFNLLDFTWQMGQMPIWYPVRYAYIFDFFLLVLASRNFNSESKNSIKSIIISIAILLVLIGIGFITSGNLDDKINVPAKIIYLSLSILIIIYYAFMINNKDIKRFALFILVIELCGNTYISLKNNGNVNSIRQFKNDYKQNVSVLKGIDDDSFYRVSFNKRTITDNGLLVGYNDLSYFSSVRNHNTFKVLNEFFGLYTFDECNLRYYYNNPIVNSLFDIKYYNTTDNMNYYEKIDKNIYLNKDATNIGFITNENILNLKYGKYVNNLNNLIKTINSNNKDAVKEIKKNYSTINCSEDLCISNGEGIITYTYTSSDNEFLYIDNNYPASDDKAKYEIIINDKTYSNIKTPYLLKKNDKVTINIRPQGIYYKDYDYHVYTLNYNSYKDFVKSINTGKLVIDQMDKDDYIKGHVTLSEDGLLFTSIANDNGWKVYVDGKETTISPILDGLIGIKLTKGKHDITFKYDVPGLKIGTIISVVGLISLVTISLIKKK